MLPQAIEDLWHGFPANSAAGVGTALLLPIMRPSLSGMTLFIAGNEIHELEEALHETRPMWMGAKLSEDFEEGQRRLQTGEPAFKAVNSGKVEEGKRNL